MEVPTTLKNSQWILSCKIVGWIGIGIALGEALNIIGPEIFKTIGTWMIILGGAGVFYLDNEFKNKKQVGLVILVVLFLLALMDYFV